jgi:ankyrin repeat protein
MKKARRDPVCHMNTLLKSPILYSLKIVFIWLLSISFLATICEAGALHIAASEGNVDKVKQLISKKVDLNELASDPKSEHDLPRGTPLHWAVQEGHEDVVRILIKAGADVNKKTDLGECLMVETPLDYAVWNRRKNIVVILLEAGADVEGAHHVFFWPLQAAISIGATDIAGILLDHGADINRSGVDGYTALHEAIFKNQKAAAKFLLARGANVNAHDLHRGGGTALHLAVENGDEYYVKLLLAHGADVSIEDSDGVTPLYLAEKKGNKSIAELLRRHTQQRPSDQLDEIETKMLILMANSGEELTKDTIIKRLGIDKSSGEYHFNQLFERDFICITRVSTRMGGSATWGVTEEGRKYLASHNLLE